MAVDQSDASLIVAALSPERIAPYLRTTGGGNLDAAVRLYEWNLAISGALYEALSILEVALRNALSTQLAMHHGTLAGKWYDDPLGVLPTLAHHEPIHSRDLAADTLTIYRILDWIDADVRAWAVSLSRLQPLIAAHPS